MMDGVDRNELIGLLDQLGDENDPTVLAAARAIHAKVTAAHGSWEDLLVRSSPEEATEQPSPAADGDDDADLPPPANGPFPDDAESLRLIARLLATAEVSADLRDELEGYKADIAAGDFGDDDRRYLRALYQRLAKS